MKKKIITLFMALVLIACMSVPAFAVTPALKIPDMPEISKIQLDVKVELPDSYWDNYFKEHPIKLPEDFKINVPQYALAPQYKSTASNPYAAWFNIFKN